MIRERTRGYECEALSANVVDETGCGNAFCGAFAAALAQGATIRDGLNPWNGCGEHHARTRWRPKRHIGSSIAPKQRGVRT